MRFWIIIIFLIVTLSMCASQKPDIYLANDVILKQFKAQLFDQLDPEDQSVLSKYYTKADKYYTLKKTVQVSDLDETNKSQIVLVLNKLLTGKTTLDLRDKAEGVIRIAACLPISGKGARTGFANRQGIEIALEEFHEKSLLLGKKVQIDYYDSRGNESDAKIACQKIVKSHVVAVIGPNWSGTVGVCAPLFQEKKLPMIAILASKPVLTVKRDYIFRMCFTDNVQGTIMAQFALKNLKAKTALIVLQQDNNFAESLSTEFEKAFKEGGGRLKVVEFTKRQLERQEGLDKLIAEIKSYKSNVIFLPSYFPTAGPLIKVVRKAGVTGTFLSGDGWGRGDLLFLAGEKYVLGAYSAVNWHPTQDDPKSLNFILRFAKKYKTAPYQASAVSYDATSILLQSIQKAGSTKGEKIRNALAAATYNGVTGDNIHFNKNGDPIKPGIIQKIIPFGAVFVARVRLKSK